MTGPAFAACERTADEFTAEPGIGSSMGLALEKRIELPKKKHGIDYNR